MCLKKIVTAFIDRYWNGNAPLILAFSGGADSTALYQILRRKLGSSLHIAHVDHAWRSESSDECTDLKQQIESDYLTFHYKKLAGPPKTGNWELDARKQRMRYLVELARKLGAQAVLLGHHRTDQAETVLKGVLQGNTPAYIGGMHSVSCWGDCAVWRPLLPVSREQILSFLKEGGYSFLDDPCNHDPCFLRVRMRHDLFPQLSGLFGKEIEAPLARLGDEVAQLREYLDDRVKTALSEIVRGPFGAYAPERIFSPLHSVEQKHLIRLLASEYDIHLSKSIVEEVYQLLVSRAGNKRVCVANSTVNIDRGALFFVHAALPKLREQVPFVDGVALNAGWRARYSNAAEQSNDRNDPIASLWGGKVTYPLSLVPDSLITPVPSASYCGSKSLSKWWGDQKVPAFLRNAVPCLGKQGSVLHEFLTGRSKKNPENSGLNISLEWVGSVCLDG